MASKEQALEVMRSLSPEGRRWVIGFLNADKREDFDIRMESFASTPNDAGFYPSDQACDEYSKYIRGVV